jgi:thiaminase/transcriptional activator TenA
MIPYTSPCLALEDGLFGRLRKDTAEDWEAYVTHPFLRRLANGTLPQAGFRNYLLQDYLYLVHFSRAYALAGYKSQTLEDLRAASRTLTGLLEVEMPLHVKLCAEWGLSEQQMLAHDEDIRSLAYTRFVLDTGLAGDLLDLTVALAPCVIGYGEVALRLLDDPDTQLEGNPYREWIETYAGAEYQAVAAGAIRQLELLGQRLGADARYSMLLKTFRTAVNLEQGFWGIGETSSDAKAL